MSRLLDIIDRFPHVRVTVFGDLIVDEFIYGEIARVSREAPVLILNYDSTETRAGGAGNAASNVAALGGRGQHRRRRRARRAGRRLLAAMRGRVDTGGVVRPPGSHADQDAHPRRRDPLRQAAGRADRSRRREHSRRRAARSIGAKLAAAVRRCDALLVSDYGSGLVTPALVAEARRRLRRPAAAVRPAVLVDSRYALLKFRGVTACTPNESEVEQIFGVRIGDEHTRARARGPPLLARTRARPCSSRAAAAAWRCSSPACRRCTSRSSAPTDRRRHRRRRHGDRHDDARARRRRHLRRGRPPRQLRRRPRRDEARHGDGHGDELRVSSDGVEG
jgi:hypothetical protein